MSPSLLFLFLLHFVFIDGLPTRELRKRPARSEEGTQWAGMVGHVPQSDSLFDEDTDDDGEPHVPTKKRKAGENAGNRRKAPLTQKQKDQIEKLLGEGVCAFHVSKRLGVPPHQVYHYINWYLTPPDQRYGKAGRARRPHGRRDKADNGSSSFRPQKSTALMRNEKQTPQTDSEALEPRTPDAGEGPVITLNRQELSNSVSIEHNDETVEDLSIFKELEQDLMEPFPLMDPQVGPSEIENDLEFNEFLREFIGEFPAGEGSTSGRA